MYQTHTVRGFEPGDLLDFQQMADMAGLSVFTVRTQWEEYKMPFELIGGLRRIRRSAAEQWVDIREQKKVAIANADRMADQFYKNMLARQGVK